MLKIVLLQYIERLRAEGICDFWVACDPGVSLWAAEIINVARKEDPNLRLYCHTPYEEQTTKWAPYLRERYFAMLTACTYITMEHRRKAPSAQADAFRTIIRQSDMVLAVYDSSSARGDAVDEAMAYAAATKKPLLLIHPDTFEPSQIFCESKS